MKVKIELSPSNTIIAKLLNEKVGIYLAETWAKQFKKYIPAVISAMPTATHIIVILLCNFFLLILYFSISSLYNASSRFSSSQSA